MKNFSTYARIVMYCVVFCFVELRPTSNRSRLAVLGSDGSSFQVLNPPAPLAPVTSLPDEPGGAAAVASEAKVKETPESLREKLNKDLELAKKKLQKKLQSLI